MYKRQEDDADGEGDQGGGVAPAVLACGGDAVYEGDEAGADGDGAGDVQLAAVRAGALEQQGGDDDQEDADGDVDEEAPAPAQGVGEQAAQDGTAGEAGGEHGSVESECAVAQRSFGEGGDEQGEACGGDHGGRQALRDSGGEQGACCVDESACKGGEGQQDEAGEEDLAGPDEVGDPAEEQAEPGGAEREGRGDPLQVLRGEVELAADDRNGHVHDGEVHRQGELRAKQQEQDERLPLRHPLRRGGRARRMICPSLLGAVDR